MTSEREGVRGLVAKWRADADARHSHARQMDGVHREYGLAKVSVLHNCADELEAMLSATTPPPADDDGLTAAYMLGRHDGRKSPPPPADAEVRARELLDTAMGEYGFIMPTPAYRRLIAAIAALSQQPEPKAEARGGVDVEAVEKVIGEMTDYLDQEVDPELDTIEKWRNALTEARNVR